MYPEGRIINMVEGYKVAMIKKERYRAAEIKRFLLDRNVILSDDGTWQRK